jgi:CDP-diacylglycerol---glycerol-3-phosphate 3-phosphatidyltransferase
MFADLARKYTRFFIEPLARFMSRTGASPNIITVIGFLMMCGVAVILSQGYFFWGGLLMIPAGIFDAIDGMMARMMGWTSRFGAFLDSTLDRYSEAVLFFGLFVYLSGQDAWVDLVLIFATVIGSLMVSYVRARAEGIGIPLKDGLFTRFERLFLLAVGLLFNQLTLVLIILAVMSNFTAFQRIYLVWRALKLEEKQELTGNVLAKTPKTLKNDQLPVQK